MQNFKISNSAASLPITQKKSAEWPEYLRREKIAPADAEVSSRDIRRTPAPEKSRGIYFI